MRTTAPATAALLTALGMLVGPTLAVPVPQFSFPTGSSTRTDLDDGVCKPITVIFARGTTESGNVGTVTGPPMFTALEDTFGAENVAVQGVDYAATVAGFLGDPDGNAAMAADVEKAATGCPGTNIVLSGYRCVLSLALALALTLC